MTTTLVTGDDTKNVTFGALGLNLTINSALAATNDMEGTVTAASTGASSFQVGLDAASTSRISLSVGDATKEVLGKVSGSTAISSVDLSSAANAQTALTTINAAIDDVSKIRGDIGAAQNQLSYASANLATAVENMSAAESVIRDVDMAAEMTTFTKNQILLQAGTAMLAQANMAPQAVLSLFG